MDDYDKHRDTIVKDLYQSDLIYGKYDSAYKIAIVDEEITVDELKQLIDYTNEYGFHAEDARNHLYSFNKYVQDNKILLKKYEVDTYELKKGLGDSELVLSQTINIMETVNKEMLAYLELNQSEVKPYLYK